jgi:hypothetical protein
VDSNLAYKTLHMKYVKGLRINKIATETGLTLKVVSGILSSVRMPEVANDFFNDRKAGADFSRTYPKPKYSKLSRMDYHYLESRYMSLLYKGMMSLQEIRSHLLEDDIEPAQADKLMQTLKDFLEAKHGDILDSKLEKVLDVLAQDTRWRMTAKGIVTVYPFPLLDADYNVTRIEYQEGRSFYLPDELWTRFNKEVK